MAAVVVALLLTLSAAGLASEDSAMVTGVEPRSGVPGTVLTLTGVGLGAPKVEEVYLSDLRFNLMVKILEQTPNRMTIRIPPFAKAGRYQILFLVHLKDQPVLLEQPAYVQIQPGEFQPQPVEAAKTVPPAVQSQPAATPVAEPKAAPAQVAEVRPPEPAPAAPAAVAAVAPPPAARAKETEAEAGSSGVSATPVEIVTRTPPVYPGIAKQMRLSGAVKLQVMVDSKGKVSGVEVLDGNPILAAAASEAARRWNYRAATLRGKPVTASTMVTIEFNGY